MEEVTTPLLGKRVAAFGNANAGLKTAVYFMQLDFRVTYGVRPAVMSALWDPAEECRCRWGPRQLPSSLVGTKALV